LAAVCAVPGPASLACWRASAVSGPPREAATCS
jgi:hypothetical protein